MIKTFIAIVLIALTTAQDGKTYKMNIYVNNKGNWSGNLEANRILYPGEAFSKGIYFKMLTPVNGDLSLVLEKDNDLFYIPYRFLSADATYTNPIANNKYISLTFKNTPSKSYNIRLDFEYALLNIVISDTEAGKLKNRINFNRSTKIAQITEIKRSIIDAAASYSINKSTYDEATASGLDIDSKISSVEKEKEEIQKKIESDVASLAEIRKKIEEIERDLAEIKNSENVLISKLSENDSEINSLTQNINDLESQNSESYLNAATFDMKVMDAANDFKTQVENLQNEIPSLRESLEKVKNSLLLNNDLESVKERIRTV
jgi:hypothetical protein